jgi:ABC-type sugar transport system ATPase subunit
MTDADGAAHIVRMDDITKRFGEVVALQGVDFAVRRGEVMALAGDNGAGKSTLIKCLAGAHQPTSGTIHIDGEPVEIDSPRTAKALGIETTFQDLAVAGNLSVAQNIFLGREETRGPDTLFGVLDKESMRSRAAELLADLEIGVDPGAKVSNLSGGERQLVAISRTMLSDPKLVIMDEPTSALSVEGADRVLDLIARMRDNGISIVLISHNLDYARQAADRVTILHNGTNAGVIDADTATRDDIVSRMVSGRIAEDDADAAEDGQPASP